MLTSAATSTLLSTSEQPSQPSLEESTGGFGFTVTTACQGNLTLLLTTGKPAHSFTSSAPGPRTGMQRLAMGLLGAQVAEAERIQECFRQLLMDEGERVGVMLGVKFDMSTPVGRGLRLL